MLKGHAKIELTDINTGTTETIEHNNMITNAVGNIVNSLKMAYGTQGLNDEFFPLSTKGMGGIMLFENPLTENIDNIAMPQPSESNLTAYANNEVNGGTDTARGSKNLTESEELTNGYKYVWDFATNQGNGIIAALALTNTIAGVQPFDCACNSGKTSEITYKYSITSTETDENKINKQMDLCASKIYDDETKILTCIRTTSETSIRIAKYKIVDSTIKLNNQIRDMVLIFEKNIDLSKTNITATYILSNSTYRTCTWNDGNDGYLYGLYSYEAGNGSITVIRINKETLEIDTEYGKKTTPKVASGQILYNFDTVDNRSAYHYISTSTYAIALNGYIYASTYSNAVKKLYKFNINNLEDVQEKEINKSGNLYPDNNIILSKEFCIFADFAIKEYNNDNIQKTFLNNNAYKIVDKNGTVLLIYYGNNAVQIYFNCKKNYLATINNLETPVEKTADKTMKITYTITDAEE